MTFRIPLEVDKELEKLASMEDSDKSKLIRELIILGIKERRISESIKLYLEGRITLWKAARIADISLWKMIEISPGSEPVFLFFCGILVLFILYFELLNCTI